VLGVFRHRMDGTPTSACSRPLQNIVRTLAANRNQQNGDVTQIHERPDIDP
jgi:hypothetical protein